MGLSKNKTKNAGGVGFFCFERKGLHAVILKSRFWARVSTTLIPLQTGCKSDRLQEMHKTPLLVNFQ